MNRNYSKSVKSQLRLNNAPVVRQDVGGFFSHWCQDVTWREIVSFCPPVLNPDLRRPFEITQPPVCSQVVYQRQWARGERKPQNTKLFIETNSEQEGKYLVSSTANGRRRWSSPRLKWGGTAGPLFSDRMVHSVGSLQEAQHHRHKHTHSLSLSHMHAHIHTNTHTHVCPHLHGHSHKNHNIPLLLWMFY